VARDARLNASDLPDGTSEIFLLRDMDTPQLSRRTALPVGQTRREIGRNVNDLRAATAEPGKRLD
jgi:hypothetical protein